MKEKRMRMNDRLTVTLGLCLLLAAGLYALLWPHAEFSDAERRYLSASPSAPSLTEWKTDKETESYLSDRVPFRSTLVAADACMQVATGRRTLLETWPVAGAFLEQPVYGTAENVQKRLAQFEALAEKTGVPWQVVVPRTHGWLLKDRMNCLLKARYEEENVIYEALEENAHFVDALPSGADAEEMYYRTDHHWTLAGAWKAYEACCAADNLPVYQLSDFILTEYLGFFGTTHSRSGLPAFTGDTLLCAEPRGTVTMTLEDGTQYDHLIFPEQAETYDGYAVYLNGNHGVLEITNPDAPGGTLLVYKDSYANCLLPLLAADYSRIVAVDVRYCRRPFSEFAENAGKVDKILFVYSADSLLNDTSVAGMAGK